MGGKAKRPVGTKTKGGSLEIDVSKGSKRKREPADFLPLEGGPGERILKKKEPFSGTATVVYIGRIPHGFYEDQMKGFFEQFGTIKRLKIARNKKTGRSKHYGFIEFENPEVAKIVADEMNNYKLMEHLLQVQLIPSEQVHPRLWKGIDRGLQIRNWRMTEQKRHNKEKSLEEHRKLVEQILKRDEKRRKKIQAAGIEYECPEFVGNLMPAPKKIKFDED